MPAEAGIQPFRMSLDSRVKHAGMTRRKEGDHLRNPGQASTLLAHFEQRFANALFHDESADGTCTS